MARCDVCGKRVRQGDGDHRGRVQARVRLLRVRDPRDRAALRALRCTVIGHGQESDGRFYCGASCATAEGVRGAVDRIDAEPVATA